jgi:hypothetical protein
MTLAEQSRLDALGDGGPVKIEINVASWAAAGKPAPALPPPKEVDDDTFTV